MRTSLNTRTVGNADADEYLISNSGENRETGETHTWDVGRAETENLQC